MGKRRKRVVEWGKHRKTKTPCALGVIILPVDILDFATQEGIDLASKVFKNLSDASPAVSKEMPKNSPVSKDDIFLKNRKLDRAVMNATTKANPIYDVFSAPFLEGEKIYDGGFFGRERMCKCA